MHRQIFKTLRASTLAHLPNVDREALNGEESFETNGTGWRRDFDMPIGALSLQGTTSSIRTRHDGSDNLRKGR